jgi:hypothetical protein
MYSRVLPPGLVGLNPRAPPAIGSHHACWPHRDAHRWWDIANRAPDGGDLRSLAGVCRENPVTDDEQQPYRTPTPALGTWVIDDEAAGPGHPGTAGLVTADGAAFIPHRIVDRPGY